ncbi:MAG: Trk family potassium uptake protein [Planctomycetes bacterium]|nr:Trk family potassium uptake protein [Planctomycetota bacterium]
MTPLCTDLDLFQKITGKIEVLELNQFYLLVIQIYLTLQLLLGVSRFYANIASHLMQPGYILLVSYFLLILIGTTLLLLPKSSASQNHPIGVLDAVFTSTSAACVTGLVIRDTGTDFSTAGQIIILVLIQLGGLGLITFVTFISLLQQQRLGLRETIVLRDALNYNVIGDLGKFLGYVFLITIGIELLGAALLLQYWNEPNMEMSGRIKWSIFHSISAFCNAGFGLKGSSFISYSDIFQFNLIIMGLIVIGGLGYPVLINFLQFKISSLPFFRRIKWIWKKSDTLEISRINVQTKIVLLSTAILIVVGVLSFVILEYDNTLKSKTLPDKVTTSLFQSVTTRTAGFNTIPIEELKISTLVMLMGFMIIGASPLSCGGGIKTVTFVVLFATLISMIRNHRVEIMKRAIPVMIVRSAISIVFLYSLTAFISSFILCVTDPGIPYHKLLFEVVSALSTVGLSTGITSSLSITGKLILCILMLIGRIGPLMVILSISSQSNKISYEYPEENIIVS